LISLTTVAKGVRGQLLDTQRNAVGFPVDLENPHLDRLAFLDVLGHGVLAEADAVVGQICQVHQPVDAAQVHERAEWHDLADHALHRVASLSVSLSLAAFSLRSWSRMSRRERTMLPLPRRSSWLTWQGELLADHHREVFDPLETDLAGGHERPVPRDFEFQPALVDAGDLGLDDLADLKHLPRGLLDRAGFGADVQRLAGLEAIDYHFQLIADLGQGIIRPLDPRSDAEFLGAELDEDICWPDRDDRPGPVLSPGLDHARAVQLRLGPHRRWG